MENPEEIYVRLKTSPEGLSDKEAAERLKIFGPNQLKPPQKARWLWLFLEQFKSPFILLLIGAALLSFLLKAVIDASIICTIIGLSGLLGFFQEWSATNALERLLALVSIKASVLRSNTEREIVLENVVPGDLIYLRVGDTVPADATLINANRLTIDESILTGESFPSEKMTGSPLYFGTTVISGIGTAIVEMTGKKTRYGQIVETVRSHPQETAFEIGVKKFGELLLLITIVVTSTVFAVNTWLGKPPLESLLFSLAIAVGLTPQLLPAIIAVNLSHGARRMAKKKVIVKRLASIENFGQMQILCCDKTGTLTEGKMQFIDALGIDGNTSEKCMEYGSLNAAFQAGYANPLDSALINAKKIDTELWKKLDEIPYDFQRKRISVLFSHQSQKILIAKGAFPQIYTICSHVENRDGSIVPIESMRTGLDALLAKVSLEGKRALGVAYGDSIKEENLVFLGFLLFSDPIKPHIETVVAEMRQRGIAMKIVTGDRHEVAMYVANQLQFDEVKLITGSEIKELNDYALTQIALNRDVFAEIEPDQKRRIISSLRKAGAVVGYLGDGVNDVSALHDADVGIAVESGSDAAKSVADIVLLEKNLEVLKEGILEGRRTFINTMKYVYMASSANFGTMLSVAGVSLFLKFLPLLPKQVLLTNFFSDLPEMTLARENVDRGSIKWPVRWDLGSISRFMLIFGALNSLADYLAFYALYEWYQADEASFRTGWFIENTLSSALIVLAIRTRRLFCRSKPSKTLFFSVAAIVIATPLLPYSPLGRLFELYPIPLSFYWVILGILIWFFASVEIAKHFFFKSVSKPR